MSDFELITKKYARSTFVTGPELSSVKTELSGVKEDLNDKQDKLMTFSEDWVNDTDIAANRITMRAGSDTVGIIIADNQINIDTESIKIEQKEHNGWKNVLKSRIEYFGPSSVQLGDSDTITIIDGKSVFVNGPLMTVDGSLFVSGPVIKEITSSDNSVSIFVDGPKIDLKVQGGGGMSLTDLKDIFDTYATVGYAISLANAKVGYDGHIARAAALGVTPMSSTVNWEMNVNNGFLSDGVFGLVDVMIPKITTKKDNVYIGCVNVFLQDSAIGKTFHEDEFILLTHSPLGTAGEYSNVSLKIKDSYTIKNGSTHIADDCYWWSGWLDGAKESGVGQFIKTVDADDNIVYEFVGIVNGAKSTLLPAAASGETMIDKYSDLQRFKLRSTMYMNISPLVSFRWIYAPFISNDNRLITRREAYEIFSEYQRWPTYPDKLNDLATREFVQNMLMEYVLNEDWDMSYAPLQPDLPEE